MTPLYDFKCDRCGHSTEDTVPADYVLSCTACGEAMRKILSFGGYAIKGDNSASQTPSHAGSFRREKK